MKGKIYVLNNWKIQEQILQKNCEPVDIRYPGQQRILELIKRNYWWLGIWNDIKKYIQGFQKCQQNKVQHMKKVGELYPLKISQGLWQKISIDIIGPLPRSNNKDAIVVIVDQFIKIIKLKATTTTVSSEKIAKIQKENSWKIHRVQKKILSDRGFQFVSQFMKDLSKVLETKITLSIVYHSQTDRKTEIINQEVKEFLQYYVNYQQDDWTEWLSVAEF